MIPILPESAPFAPAQRAWLNGFFAGIFNLDRGTNLSALNGTAAATSALGAGRAAPEETFPWHDPSLPMDERLNLAEGKPHERVLMAAMAQLDCGACGYLCKTYSEAIANGQESDLTKCSPGGKDTAKKLKELTANRKGLPVLGDNGHASSNGHAGNGALVGKHLDAAALAKSLAAVPYDRKKPFPAPLLWCNRLTKIPGSEKDVRHVAFNPQG